MKKETPSIIVALTLCSFLLVGATYYIPIAKEQGTTVNTISTPQYDSTSALVKDEKDEEVNKISPAITSKARVENLPNFVDVAKIITPAVVHIKAINNPKIHQNPAANQSLEHLFKEFFGERFQKDFFGERFQKEPKEYEIQPQLAIGSGVIYTADGYIITNCHVVDRADEIKVTLDDNRSYTAKLVGKDLAVDLALLKIEEKKLPYLKIGSSDALQVGDWVLAVGNPFNLNSTVTKGIVSAKARQQEMPNQGEGKLKIQSFIQTDAAVNLGSSGGALVNLKGELVGINTAISSRTDAFTGHAFAIPSSLVKKVADDLIQHGVVQRAILGIMIRNIDASFAKKEKLNRVQGVYIQEVNKGDAGAQAGLKGGDIIIAINGRDIKRISELQERIGCCRPNERIHVTFDRKGKILTVPLVLKQMVPSAQLVFSQHRLMFEGATFENVDNTTQKRLKITGGAFIKELKAGKFQNAGINQGFIITAIDKNPVQNISTLHKILKNKKGVILVEGIYIDGRRGFCALDIDTMRGK